MRPPSIAAVQRYCYLQPETELEHANRADVEEGQDYTGIHIAHNQDLAARACTKADKAHNNLSFQSFTW